MARPSGSSINNPVHSASAATKVGNPIATSEALSNQKSPFDLSQSGQQSAENDKGSQPIQGPYRSPVQVSDDSDVEYIIGIEIFRTVYQTKIIEVWRIGNTILP